MEIIGLAEVPGAGDIFDAVDDEKMARELVEQRKDKEKEEESSASAGGSRGFSPLIIPFAGQSSSTYSNINESRPVRRFSGDVGVGSKASVTARGRSFFGFGSGS